MSPVITERTMATERLADHLEAALTNGTALASSDFRAGWAAALRAVREGIGSFPLPVPTIPPDAVLREAMEGSLVWLPEWGMGYHAGALETLGVYGAEYWHKYVEYAGTPLGRELTRLRCELVSHYYGAGELVDVGIGCGAFIEHRQGRTVGFDINPVGERWLLERGLSCNPYQQSVAAATFWDSLEHLGWPADLLKNVREWAFISLPLFTDATHVLSSKHYRRDEHVWYWTRAGLVRWMRAQGFTCQAHDTRESLAGREDIHTFAFRRASS